MKNINLVLLPLATAAFSSRSPLLFRPTSSSLWPSTLNNQCRRHNHSPAYYHLWPNIRPPSHNYSKNIMTRKVSAATGEIIMEGAQQHDNNRGKMKILGICGGIGSGKSTACQLMVDSLGCAARIDADKLAHVVYEPGSNALNEIAAEFGQDILDDDHSTEGTKTIDRKKLGAIVFNDAEAMSKLEQIVWPHVRTKIEEQIDEIKTKNDQLVSNNKVEDDSKHNNNNIIIVEAALLLETNWHDLLDGLWVIQSSPSVAIQRLMDNRGLSEEEALVRIRAQEKRRGIGGGGGDKDDGNDEGICKKLQEEMDKGVVTSVITNDGTLEELEEALQKALCNPASFKQ